MISKIFSPYLFLCLSPEGEGAGGAPAAAAPNPSIVGGAGGSPAAGGGAPAPVAPGAPKAADAPAWRVGIAALADDADREAIEGWAARFTDSKAFVKGLLDVRKAATARPAIPDEKASPEDRHAFFKQLGKPDKAEEYALKDEGYDDPAKARLGEFKNFAHELHLTQAQAEKLQGWYDAQDKAAADGMMARLKTMRSQNEAALKQQWGADYDTNVNLATEAGGFFFKTPESLDSFAQFLRTPLSDGSVPGNHPVMLQMLSQIGRLLAEDQTVAKFDNPALETDIKGQIDAITQEAIKAGRGTHEEPFHSKLEPLYKKLHGSKPLNFRQW